MRPSVQQPISKDKNVYGPDKKILFKKPLFDLEVKSQGHRKVIMVPDTPPYGHAPIYQISLTYLERKQLFDLEVKGQGPTKVIMVCDTPPYGHAHTHQISLTYLERQKCYGPDNKILFKKTLFDLEVKVHKCHYGTRHTVLWSCTHIPNIIDLSRKTKNVMGQDKKILFKKQLFDLHVKGQGPTKVIMVCNTPPYGHAPTYQISLTYLERNNYLTLRSKDKVP